MKTLLWNRIFNVCNNNSKTMNYFNYALFSLLISCISLSFVACEKEEKQEKPELSDSLVNLKIETENGNELTGDVHWFVFDNNDVLIGNFHYVSVEELLHSFIPTKTGNYTYVIVMGSGSNFTFATTKTESIFKLSDLFKQLTLLEKDYPDIQTGLVRNTLEKDKITQITLKVQKGITKLATLCLNLTVPMVISQPFLDEKAITRSGESAFVFRCVAEVYNSKSNRCIMHRSLEITHTNNPSNYIVNLEYLTPDSYEVLLWADYASADQTDGFYYDTASLKAVSFNTGTDYIAGVDTRNAYFEHITSDLTQVDTTKQDVTMKYPFARYRILATDKQKYEEMKGVNGYPELEDIEVQAFYNCYFPSAYSVWDEAPNNATKELSFESNVLNTSDGDVQIMSDYVLVGDMKSSVLVNITLANKNTGKVFSSVKDIRVNYKRGYLTTISGDFLTAGIKEGSISTEERWDGEFNVEF